ncbi:AMP-binding protein [Amycolatopsis sp. NPDC088138]|uniref:non-ribosomal peptide synthetase n=1 Tax=Amycolatopsis sp. NPDC088138 TaxID=3363938 RepID=UPI003827C561
MNRGAQQTGPVVALPEESLARVRRCAEDARVRPADVLLAATAVLFGRWSGRAVVAWPGGAEHELDVDERLSLVELAGAAAALIESGVDDRGQVRVRFVTDAAASGGQREWELGVADGLVLRLPGHGVPADPSAHFARLLAALLADPRAPVGTAESTPAGERADLDRWSRTDLRGPVRPVLARLAETAREHPDRIAVSGVDGELSFAELVARVGALAGRLAGCGVGRSSRIGVHLPRTTELVRAQLAAWWLGACFVPLEQSYSDGRLADIAADAGLDLVVSLADRLPWAPGVPVLRPGPGTDGPIGPVTADPADTAYLMYTSGSTGRPKGVAVPHGSVALLFASLESSGCYPAEHARVVCNASTAFDASVQQWLRLCRGDAVHLVDEDTRLDPVRFGNWLRYHEVTDVDATPSHWAAVRDEVLAAVSPGRLRLYLGGERVPGEMWRDLGLLAAEGDIRSAVNLYGPTECTVDVTAAPITGAEPHIGAPLPGRRVHVLDRRLRPVAVGVTGELYVGGGLATGYAGDPGRTAHRFVADPFSGGGDRLYRTGDRVCRRPDGTLLYLDRQDRQVKVRGHRIELGEVESVLTEVDGVDFAVAVVRDGNLFAYYTSAHECTERLLAHLRERLPAAMVPTALVRLDVVPRTAQGKVDLAALPSVSTTSAIGGTEPRGEVRTLIAQAWCEVLGLDQVSTLDDFFALGGHSLVALRVVSLVKKRLGVVLRTKDVYRYPRLDDLAEHVERLGAARQDAR